MLFRHLGISKVSLRYGKQVHRMVQTIIAFTGVSHLVKFTHCDFLFLCE